MILKRQGRPFIEETRHALSLRHPMIFNFNCGVIFLRLPFLGLCRRSLSLPRGTMTRRRL